MNGVFDGLLTLRNAVRALRVHREALREFHARAARVLEGLCPLRPYERADFSIGRNFFSTLFLVALRGAGLPERRLRFYALVNQCMRAWVTGCDNLLDDEFKSVIPFSLPAGGHRFLSVLTIMAADRVFSDLLCDEVAGGRLAGDQAKALSRLTLRVLLPSGLQEHEEELGARTILPPDDLVELIHVPKTGLLFEAPITVPERLGEVDMALAARARAGLRAFGLGCQVLDDVVDFERDVASRRHNLVLSLAVHSNGHWRRRSPTHADVSLGALPVQAGIAAACERSLGFFRQARSLLEPLGLRLSERQWRHLLLGIGARLRVPPQAQELIGSAL